MDRLLITGIDSVAGYNIALTLADRFRVFGVSYRQTLQLPGIETFRCQSDDIVRLTVALCDSNPQWIIHCGELSRPAWDLTVVSMAEQELQTVRHLAELAGSLRCQLTVLTSDAVFCGPRMFHDETSEALADSSWAKLAHAAEKLLEPTGALVARSCAYGWSAPGGEPGFAEKMWECLSSPRALHADGIRYASPILASDLAELLAKAYERRLHGLFHFAGAERCSPFRFACELAGVFGFSPPRLQNPVTAADVNGPVGETSLSSRKASRAVGLPLPMLREGLYRFADQYASGWAGPRQLAGKAAAELCNHAA